MRIGVEITATVHIGDIQRNEYAKIRISVDDLDPDQNVENQLKHSAATINSAYSLVSTMLEKRVAEIVNG